MDEIEENNSSVPLVSKISLVFGKFSSFLETRGFANQLEKNVKGRMNVGFVDSAFEKMMKSVGWQSSNAWCGFYVKLILMQLFSFDKEWLSKNFGRGALENFNKI